MATAVASQPALDKTWLVAGEVASRLRMSNWNLRDLVASHRIPVLSLRPGARNLFAVEDLEAWLGGAELEVIELAGGGQLIRPRNVEADSARAGSDQTAAVQSGRHVRE